MSIFLLMSTFLPSLPNEHIIRLIYPVTFILSLYPNYLESVICSIYLSSQFTCQTFTHSIYISAQSTFLSCLPIKLIIRSMYLYTKFTYQTYYSHYSIYPVISILPCYPVNLLNLSFAPSTFLSSLPFF